MIDLDEILKCKEHEAPLIICTIRRRRKKDSFARETIVVCPVDQKLETIALEVPPEELDDLALPLADKIFRCEKCFREAEFLDTAVTKKSVSLYIQCSEHGQLIMREIATDLYDKIKNAWDMKGVKPEEEKLY